MALLGKFVLKHSIYNVPSLNLIVPFLLARAIIRKNYAEKLKMRFHKIKKVGYMVNVLVSHNILPFWLIIFGVQVDVHCRFKFRILVKIEVLATFY